MASPMQLYKLKHSHLREALETGKLSVKWVNAEGETCYKDGDLTEVEMVFASYGYEMWLRMKEMDNFLNNYNNATSKCCKAIATLRKEQISDKAKVGQALQQIESLLKTFITLDEQRRQFLNEA